MRLAILVPATLVLGACAGSPDADPKQSAAADSSPAGPTAAECAAWLADVPVPDGTTTCAQPRPDAVARLQDDGARHLALASGRYALAWLPADWAARDDRSLLVVLHGTTGCAEATLADMHTMLGDSHGLLSLAYGDLDGGFVEPDAIQADLDEAHAAMADHCPMDATPTLMYGISRGGARALALGGLDRAGPARLSGVVVDSGTLPGRQLDGLSFEGARYLLWCGEHDPDPVQEGRTTCEVMEQDLAPLLERRGATVDAVVVGTDACHGMQQWDCAEDCSTCDGTVTRDDVGPHVATIAEWLSRVAAGG